MSLPDRYDAAAQAAMRRLVDRSRRHSGLQLPPSFARGGPNNSAPLSRMIQGGRGGEARLKLYLSTALLAGSAHSHPIYGANAIFNVSAPSWARALALPDPDANGARRVADAQTWLRRAKLLNVERRAGAEPVVRLLSADGGNRPWTRPTSPYITVPLNLWEKHWIWFLGAKEVAVLIALLDLQGGRAKDGKPEPQWMGNEERDRYGFSADTWRLATSSLEKKGILRTDFANGLHRDFETKRRRKTYWVIADRLETDALDVFEEALDSTSADAAHPGISD